MTENTRDIALSWVQTLQARGVGLRLRNNRLELRPAHAYKELSDQELLTLRHHRGDIKRVVRDGHFEALPSPPPPTPPPAPEPEPCEHCYRSPTECADLRTTRPDIWSVLHARHPEEDERRRREATAVMMRQIPNGVPAWYWE